jgi:putative transposase
MVYRRELSTRLSHRGASGTSRTALCDRHPQRQIIKHLLADDGILGSMSRSGNCWDNAVAERFFATQKGSVPKSVGHQGPKDVARL